jgi:hypothetical protein
VALYDYRMTASSTWDYWTAGTTATVVTYPTTAATVTWNLWTGDATTASVPVITSTSQRAWVTWNGMATNCTPSVPIHHAPASAPPPETEEARVRRLAEAARRKEEWDRREAERKRTEAEAEAKATTLLAEHLDAAQRAQYAADRSFTVVAASGRRYRLRSGWAGNVDGLDERGRAFERLCIHPTVGVPHPDNQLAQKLMLDADEERFRKVAIITPLKLVG